MKLKMAKNSLFAILLRSPWWVSAAIGVALAALAAALMPREYRLVGAMSALPFVVIAGLAARSQWRAPSAARIVLTLQATSALTWPAFADLLEQAFRRDRFAVERRGAGAADFALQRDGRQMLVSARRWKS
ncbi:MAG: restriction endonuclease, partial [Rhizobacter sp.]|nr:restriction endonuclease [Rhizobacter sp.]